MVSKLKPECYGGFAAPPVIEVVCGVVFEPIPRFSTAFFGLLWNLFGEEFPKTVDQPPLLSPAQALVPGKSIRIPAGPPLPRVWFMSVDERRLIQVQRDRFHYNWRRQDDSDEYPRFPDIFCSFKDYYETLVGFDTDNGGKGLIEIQYELTYVNHIPVSHFGQGFGQIGNVLPDVSWRAGGSRFLPTPSGMRWESQFPMPDGAGILSANARTARTADTGEPVITLDMSARGPAGTLDFDDWFNVGREWIVKGFIDLTDEDIQNKVWEKQKE